MYKLFNIIFKETQQGINKKTEKTVTVKETQYSQNLNFSGIQLQPINNSHISYIKKIPISSYLANEIFNNTPTINVYNLPPRMN